MTDVDICDSDTLSLRKSHDNPELVSIRKKLVAPNDILPGLMHRSRLPIHLLPVRPDFQSQPGHQMPLADVQSTNQDLITEKNKVGRPKNHTSKVVKYKSKTEFSEKRGKYPSLELEADKAVVRKSMDDGQVEFLHQNLRSLTKHPEQLVFVSKTLLINFFKGKQSMPKEGETQKINEMYIKAIANMPYFAAIPFAFDQFKPQQLRDYPAFTNHNFDLQFDDNFQSSNLFTATHCNTPNDYLQKVRQTYLLTIRLDYNTKSYGQWFYFNVKRKEQLYSFSRTENNLYKFMIINMTKSTSMFGDGLKISVCRNGVWRKEGTNIKYYQNSIRKDEFQSGTEPHSTHYTLEFTLQIYQGQDLYISYNQPYTFTRAGKLLDKISTKYEQNARNIIDIKRNIICPSFLQNNIEVLNFTAKSSPQRPQTQQKKVIFIVSRCHPAQTAGSHVLQGILNVLYQLFLVNPIEQQKNHIIYRLLQHYIIKIIPMLNPDGVILGNSRCNIAGFDLNRTWRTSKPDNSRQIHLIKKYILDYQSRIVMFIDLHAHSKKKNVFAYGCHDNKNPFSTREFPFLLSKLSQNDFVFKQCRFNKLNKNSREQKGTKDGTARVFLYDVLRIPNVFTIENSYCSAKNSMFHYDRASYSVIGSDILKAISLYFAPEFYIGKINNNYSQDNDVHENDLTSEMEPSKLKISLDSGHSHLEVKVKFGTKEATMGQNGQPPFQQKVVTAVNLRNQYLQQLRANQNNINFGFLPDQASESQDQDRIYEPILKKQILKSPRKCKRQSKTTDKLLNYLQKNKQDIKQSPQRHKEHKRAELNVSSTHSQISLSKTHKYTPTHTKNNRFYTINRTPESVCVSMNHTFVPTQQPPSQAIHFKRKIQTQRELHQKKDKFLSIVDLGLAVRTHTHATHNYRLNIAQKNMSKPNCQNYRTLEHERERSSQEKYESTITYPQEKEIKEYLRKLARPRQLLQKKQHLKTKDRIQKNQKQELKIKQSSIQFSNSKLTRLIITQDPNPYIPATHTTSRQNPH